MHSVSYALKPEIMIKLDGFEWSQWHFFGTIISIFISYKIGPSYEDSSTINLYDVSGSILLLQFDQLGSTGNGCILSFWCEYWLVNSYFFMSSLFL